jgi:hypothetical protein
MAKRECPELSAKAQKQTKVVHRKELLCQTNFMPNDCISQKIHFGI